MATNRLVMSDLHFGSGDDLLRSGEALERIRPELEWADELVLNGDLFELVFAAVHEAVASARPFLALVDECVSRVVYLPGNHDHHLVARAGDERRFAEVMGHGVRDPFSVPPAARLLQSLMPQTDIVTAYPIVELDGAHYHHGHYLSAHVETFGWRMLDRLAWTLTGQPHRDHELGVTDYEALVVPLYELMYAIANLPAGRLVQQQFEKRLASIAAVARAPMQLSRQVAGVASSLLRRRAGASNELLDAPAPTSEVLRGVELMCENLAVAPGPFVFGHTHVPLDGVPTASGRLIYNSGSWMWDSRLRHQPYYREMAWPGCVLRVQGEKMELKRLLDDCTDADLKRMLGAVPDPARRKRLRRRTTSLAVARA